MTNGTGLAFRGEREFCPLNPGDMGPKVRRAMDVGGGSRASGATRMLGAREVRMALGESHSEPDLAPTNFLRLRGVVGW